MTPTVSPEIRESMTPVEEYLREDPRTPDALYEQAGEDPPLVPVPTEQYTSRGLSALRLS